MPEDDKETGSVGNLNRAGRPKGTPNKLTRTVKEAFQVAFEDLQGDPTANLLTWAKENTTDFYKIASKLIPQDLNATVTHRDWVDILDDIRPSRSPRTDGPVAH